MLGGTLESRGILMRIDPETRSRHQSEVAWTFLSRTHRGFRAGARHRCRLVASVIAVESNFNPNAVSCKIRTGLMQLMPETAARFGVTRMCSTAPEYRTRARATEGTPACANNGNLAMTLAAYNAGRSASASFRPVPAYRETRDYVRRVTDKFNKNR